jgi:NAD-dependent DNA ligase
MSPMLVCPTCREIVNVEAGKWTLCDGCKTKLTDPDDEGRKATEWTKPVFGTGAQSPRAAPPVTLSHPVRASRVCVTGKIPGFTRTEVNDFLRKSGYTPQSTVTLATDLLILGESGGSYETTKIKRAKALNLRTASWKEFDFGKFLKGAA